MPLGKPQQREHEKCGLAVGDDSGTRRVGSVNPDANTVTVVNAVTGVKEAEYAVGADPRGIARDRNGRYWITCHDSDEIRVLNADGSAHATIPLAYGSAPFGVAPSPDGALLYVTLFGSGQVHRYSAAAPGDAPLTAGGLDTPRAIAISADGARVLVTRFISPEMRAEIREFDAALAEVRTCTLASANTIDGGDRAAGVPNYLAGIAISPDGTRAAIVSKQDNTQRGTFFGVGNLTHETTVRAVISFLDLANNAEIPHSRRDFDNSESPSAVTYTPLGDMLLVTHQGNNRVVGIDALNLAPLTEQITQGSTLTQPAVIAFEVGTGLAPQGVLMDGIITPAALQNLPVTGPGGALAQLTGTALASVLGDNANAAPEIEETYDDWLAANLTPDQLLDPSLTDPQADANGNGTADLMDFALGDTGISSLQVELTGPPQARVARLTLTRNSAARGVTIIVERTTDFVTWTPLATSLNGGVPTGPASISEGIGVIRPLQVDTPAGDAASFSRVRVVIQ